MKAPAPRNLLVIIQVVWLTGQVLSAAEGTPVGRVVAIGNSTRVCELRFSDGFSPVVGQHLSAFRPANRGTTNVYVSTVQISSVRGDFGIGRYTHVRPEIGDLLFNRPLLDGFGNELGQVPEQVSTTLELAAIVETVRLESTSALIGAQKRFRSEALLGANLAAKEKAQIEAATERAREALRLAEIDRRNAIEAKQMAEQGARLAEKAVSDAKMRLVEEEAKLKKTIDDIESNREEAEAALAAKEKAERELAEAKVARDKVAGALQDAREKWSSAAKDAEKRSEVAIAIIKFMSGETDELFSVNPGDLLKEKKDD